MANTSQQTTFRQIQDTHQGPFSNEGIKEKPFTLEAFKLPLSLHVCAFWVKNHITWFDTTAKLTCPLFSLCCFNPSAQSIRRTQKAVIEIHVGVEDN